MPYKPYMTHICIYDFYKKQNIFIQCVNYSLSFRQDKARTKLGKRNRKIQKKKNANKKRKKC